MLQTQTVEPKLLGLIKALMEVDLLNAKDLNEKAIKAIQERFGNAELEIQAIH